MSGGSFKERITDAASRFATAAPEAGQSAQGRGPHPLNGWADKVDNAANLKDQARDPGHGLPGEKSASGTPTVVTVQIAGKTLDVKTLFVGQIQTRLAVNEIPSATVELDLPDTAPGDYKDVDHLLSRCAVGQPATLKLGEQTRFTGVVGAVQVKVRSGGRRVRIRLKHTLQTLKATPRSRVWPAQQDSGLVRTVLNEHGVQAGGITLSEGDTVQRFQWNCSDWHFIRALLGLHGAWLWPHSDGSVTIQPPRLRGTSHLISATPGPGRVVLLDAEWEHAGLSQPKTLTLQSWDLSKQAVVKKTAKAKTLGAKGLAPRAVKALGGDGEALLTGQWDGTLQQAAADGWLAAQQAQAVRVRITVAGCQAYQPGDTLSLEGVGAHLNGQGIVTWVEHHVGVDDREGKTLVGIGLDDTAAAAPTLPVPDGLVIGQVAKFQADPKGKWNRLPVSVPLLGKAILWARMGHLYASKESGVTFYPETGDEVALGFVGGDPVILASLHNPKLTAAIEPSAKNAKKGLVLRHDGQRMELSFDRDKHTASWALGSDKTPEQRLVIDKEKGIAVTGEKGDVKVEMKAGGAAWTTKHNIALNADEQVSVTGKNGVSLASDKDVSLAAKAHLKGAGTRSVQLASEEGKLTLSPQKASLSANQVQVDGKVKVKLQGNEDVEIQGAKVAVTGEADVTVSGGTVDVKGTTEATVQAPAVKITGQTTDVGGEGITHVKGSAVNLG
ncbi:hypothetical protein KH388_22260 [Serratia rubidaea]|nr:hypothetical protein [Serratia rubidaea]